MRKRSLSELLKEQSRASERLSFLMSRKESSEHELRVALRRAVLADRAVRVALLGKELPACPRMPARGRRSPLTPAQPKAIRRITRARGRLPK